MKISQNSDSTPSGYTAYSPVYTFEPEGLKFQKPVTVSLDYTGDVNRATLFWSREGTTGFESAAGVLSNETVTAQVSHFSRGFVANGEEYDDPPDTSCVDSKLVEGRTLENSTVALFFTVDDCWGRPITGLPPSRFDVLEDDTAITSESSATILQRNGLQVFASLLIDMSASTGAFLPDVIAGARAFVNRLQVEKKLPVQIDIQLFDGNAELMEWQAPTLDTETLLDRLGQLASCRPADPSSCSSNDPSSCCLTDLSSTNLNGAVVKDLDRISKVQKDFRDRNYQGAFTTGYLVIFTDGKDTASRVTQAAAVAEVAKSLNQVIAVGLQGADYDSAALKSIALNGVITASDPRQLSAAFLALAKRMEGQISRTYLLGYCSPKRPGGSNDHTVSMAVIQANNRSNAKYKFSAASFKEGCSTATFATICDKKQCGGLGCGACDDRVAHCDQNTLQCVNN